LSAHATAHIFSFVEKTLPQLELQDDDVGRVCRLFTFLHALASDGILSLSL
jgi:hypothetical protein